MPSDWRHFPERPQLPPALLCALVFWIVCAGVYLSCKGASSECCVKGSLVSLSISLLLILAFIVYSKRIAFALFASATIASSMAFGYAAFVHYCADEYSGIETLHAKVRLLEDCSEGTYLPRALCQARLADGRSFELMVDFDDQLYKCSESVYVEGKLSLCSDTTVDYHWQRGVLLTLKATRSELLLAEDFLGLVAAFRGRAIDSIGSQDEVHAVI